MVLAFNFEKDKANTLLSQILLQIDEINARIKQLQDRKRSKEINRVFKEGYALSLERLNVPQIDLSKSKITSRPDLSGSGGPRSTLSYYSALWRVCFSRFGTYDAPIVIDAPQQMGQDDINLPLIMAFIANDLPNTQIILGSEIDTTEHFDLKIRLERQYSVLLKEEFSEVERDLAPLAAKMFASLREKNL